jgi:putative aminopeptidase FrvX
VRVNRGSPRFVPSAMQIPQALRAQHQDWLLQISQIPTAAGREDLVEAWIERWAAERQELELTRDAAGNMHIQIRGQQAADRAPVYFTAHMDHPAFIVERVIGEATVQAAFRGGVMDEYFEEARITIHSRDGAKHGATLVGRPETGCASFKSFLADLDADSAEGVQVGDLATWELPGSQIVDRLLHAPACDDLAALAAAVSAMDVLRQERSGQDVRLLLTRAEEVGFIGAIAACREGTMPRGSRVIALENSRAFDDSPIGGGPIVRVGDRLTIFSPSLSGAVAKRAEEVAGGPSLPTAVQKAKDVPAWKWQRKLMAGGACEATVFCAWGYESTCVCLPLGNYHNMSDLAEVQAGTFAGKPAIAPEYISVSDYDGLVDLLVACGQKLPENPSVMPRIEKLWRDVGFVLQE